MMDPPPRIGWFSVAAMDTRQGWFHERERAATAAATVGLCKDWVAAKELKLSYYIGNI